MNSDDDKKPDAVEDFRSTMLGELASKGVAKIEIEFDGSSDEGYIDDISATGEDGSEVDLDWLSGVSKDDAGDSPGAPRLIREILEDWAFDLIYQVQRGWENNDGSFGTLEIIPSENSIRCEFNARETYHHESHHEL